MGEGAAPGFSGFLPNQGFADGLDPQTAVLPLNRLNYKYEHTLSLLA